MVPRWELNLYTDKIKENYKSSLNPIYFIKFCVKTQEDKMKKLKEKEIKNLKKIKIIKLEEMKLQDLKILKVKIETAIKNIEKD